MRKICLIIFINSFIYLISSTPNFKQVWRETQIIYKQLIFASAHHTSIATNFWAEGRTKIRNLLLGPDNINFLKNQFIVQTMVKAGYGPTEKFEECFLTFCLSPQIKNIIKSYTEVSPTIISHDSKAFNCSSNTLQHLYYVASILEHIQHFKDLTIVEFGGGYGNVARIFTQIIPNTRYLIIDLPEILALQYLFLRYTAPQLRLHIFSPQHTLTDSAKLDTGIYLIPVNLHSMIKLKTDVFLSTFALSETPLAIQKEVALNNFYQAQFIYLTGQLNGWKESGFNWIESHEFLVNQLRKLYRDIFCMPYHIFKENLMSFELFAKNPNRTLRSNHEIRS